MGWLDWIPGLTSKSSEPSPDGSTFERAASPAETGGVGDASGFVSAAVGGGAGAQARMIALAAWSAGYVDETTRPDQVPQELIELMRFDPWVYLGERMFAAPLQDPSIYRVEHRDPAVVAEVEAWLRPLLPQLLRAITRAFALGSAPYVLDWQARDLSFERPRPSDPTKLSVKTVRGHQHYAARVHALGLAGTTLEVVADDLRAVRAGGRTYYADRAGVAVWDPEPGCWRGNGSRRRAWRAYWRGEITEVLEGSWVERGVDPPRVGYAPTGTLTIDGEQIPATEILTSALMALKGGDAAVLPASFDAQTNQPLWSVSAMQLPDVSAVWRERVNACAAQKMLASLVPPSSAGVSDGTFAAAKIPSEMFVELLESAASWVAEEVERSVAIVHAMNHGADAVAPQVVAREIPKQKVRRLSEMARAIATVPARRGEDEVTLAELVDAEALLDDLGVPRRATAEAVREKRGAAPAGPVGRPLESTSDRQDRRDEARTFEGEVATGGDDESEMPE